MVPKPGHERTDGPRNRKVFLNIKKYPKIKDIFLLFSYICKVIN